MHFFFPQQFFNAWRPGFSSFGWVSFSILFLPVKPVYWVQDGTTSLWRNRKHPQYIYHWPGRWYTTGSRICEGKSSEQDPWSHIGKQFKSLAALLSWESPSGREVCAPALEKLQRHSWRVNSWFGSVTTPVMATVMRGFSRLHPSWLSWINCECSAYRTWKVFSLSATGPFWKQDPSKASRAQNWLSNNPGVHSQVLSAFLLIRFRRVLQERKHLVKGGTAKPDFAVLQPGVQVLLPLLAFAVCSIHSQNYTGGSNFCICILPHSSAFCL